MAPENSANPISRLRETIKALERDPGPVTPQMQQLRELLMSRLRRLESSTLPSQD
jgi:hypothetical protein